MRSLVHEARRAVRGHTELHNWDESSRIAARLSLAKRADRYSVVQSVGKGLPIAVKSGEQFGKPFAVNED